jgi:hypothetical protein
MADSHDPKITIVNCNRTFKRIKTKATYDHAYTIIYIAALDYIVVGGKHSFVQVFKAKTLDRVATKCFSADQNSIVGSLAYAKPKNWLCVASNEARIRVVNVKDLIKVYNLKLQYDGFAYEVRWLKNNHLMYRLYDQWNNFEAMTFLELEKAEEIDASLRIYPGSAAVFHPKSKSQSFVSLLEDGRLANHRVVDTFDKIIDKQIDNYWYEGDLLLKVEVCGGVSAGIFGKCDEKTPKNLEFFKWYNTGIRLVKAVNNSRVNQNMIITPKGKLLIGTDQGNQVSILRTNNFLNDIMKN